MQTNAKINEHPSCGCRQCRRHSGYKTFVHKHVARTYRRNVRAALRACVDWEGFLLPLRNTPYTD